MERASNKIQLLHDGTGDYLVTMIRPAKIMEYIYTPKSFGVVSYLYSYSDVLKPKLENIRMLAGLKTKVLFGRTNDLSGSLSFPHLLQYSHSITTEAN